VKRLAAIRLDGLGHADDEVLVARRRCVGMDRVHRVKRDSADPFSGMPYPPNHLRSGDVAEVVDEHAKMAPSAIADGAAIFDPHRNDRRAMDARPGSFVTGEWIFPVFVLLS